MPDDEDRKKEARVEFGSCPEEREVRVDTAVEFPASQELKDQLDQCGGLVSPSKYSSGQVTFLLKHAVFGLLFAAFGLVILFIIWPAYSAGDSTIPGATLIFLIGGVGMTIGGPGYALWRIWDFFRGARQRTPQELIHSFVSAFDDGNYARAWVCLTPGAQKCVPTEKEYRHYLEQLKGKTAKSLDGLLGVTGALSEEVANEFSVTTRHKFSAKNIKISSEQAESALIDYDLEVEQRRSLTRKSNNKYHGDIIDGRVLFPQRNAVIMWGEKWYLVSGFLTATAEIG